MVVSGWSDGQADCRSLFEQNGLPMWVFEGRSVVEVNRAAMLAYGYSRDEFLAMTIRDLEEADGPRDGASSLSPPAADADQKPRTIWKHRRKDGSLVDVEVSAVADHVPRKAGRCSTPFSTSAIAGEPRPRRAISTCCWRRSPTRWSPATTNSS